MTLGAALCVSGVLAQTMPVQPMPRPDSKNKSQKLESHLAELVRVFAEQGPDAAIDRAQSTGLDVVDGNVRVVVTADADADPWTVQNDLVALGASVERQYETLTEALLPISALDPLAQLPEVTWVRPPIGVTYPN